MRRVGGVVVLLAAALAARSVHATTLVPATLDELTASSVAIFHGRVVDVQARWEPGRRQIESLVAVRPSAYLKGDLGDTVVVRVAGGTVGPYRSLVVGAPTFAPGDEVVLFVGASGPSYPHILGLNQGAFRVIDERVVAPARGESRRRPVALVTFVADIRELLQRRPEVGAPRRGGR